MQYVTSLGMLAAALIFGYLLYRDEVNFRRFRAETEKKIQDILDACRNKRD